MKAKTKGENEQDSFLGEYTGKVQWKFIEVTDITPLGELGDTTSLVSRIEETSDLNGYLTSVYRKAASIMHEPLYSL